MTLARLVNYVDGNTLTGAQLNNEFDNILNNGPALVSVAIPSVSIVQGLSGSMISNIGSFQANAYQLRSTSGICSLTATSSYSINTQTAGPIVNGRDQAAVFASTDVHFYAITTGGTSTNARGICSSNPPPLGPTLPAGYSAWGYLASAKYSTGTSGVTTLSALVSGAQVRTDKGGIATINTGPCAYSSFSVASVIPQIATEMHAKVTLRGLYSTNGGQLSINFAVGPDALGVFLDSYDVTSTPNATAPVPTFTNVFHAKYQNANTPPALYVQNVLNTGTSASIAINLVGYTVPNGDAG